ncbi:MAG: restriction endonuclease subunit S [Clostridia bacterium]|nr:restriction endonuclease subunit S [Clostridia bacterium]
MALNKCTLGEHIELREIVNSDLSFGINSVRGVNNLKFLMSTKADLNGRDLSKFQIVYPGEFVFNHRTSRNGSKFSIARNNEDSPIICTEDYVVFRVKECSRTILMAEWLYMFLNRSEFDRYVITNSWGSSTEFYNWEDLCAVELELPSLSIQQKYVDIYNAMVANQQSYERGLEDLKLVCDGYIEDLRRKMPCEKIGQYIQQKNERNSDKCIDFVMGLSTKKEFREAQSRVNRDELGNYKIVNPYDIAFVPTTDTWKVLAFAVNRFDRSLVVSPIYEVFSVDQTKLLSQYLAIWLSRKEFDRYARFNSWGSARENFSFEDMRDVKIPIPDIEVQKSIVDIYNAYIMRKEINEQLKIQIKDICPILIQGSLEEDKA